MLIAPQDVNPECVEKIKEEYFYVPAHQTVFRVLVEQWSAGQAIDLITFTQTLRDQNVLETIGGASFVTSLFTFVPTAANIDYYLEIVRDKYVLRQIIITCTEGVRRAYEEQGEVGPLLDEVEHNIFKVGDDRFKGQLLSMKEQVMGALESKLAEAKIFIDESPSLEILELRAKARRLKAQQNVELVLIDYLQLLRSATRRAKENRQLEISEISAGLKALAKELNIPVIVVAQLNRQLEARSGGKPRLSDLRESGSIEQDADLVGLLVRPEIYEEDEEARAEKEGEAELIIAKQRNGPVGEILLTFLKEFTRFEDRARNVREPGEAF